MKRQSHPITLTVVVFSAIAGGCLLASAKPPAKRAVTPDRATQRVLADYGVSASIVRPWETLREKAATGEKGYPILLEGDPGVRLVLGRDYWALAVKQTKGGPASYILNPKDEQSSLNISVGEGGHDRSDADLSEDPGFTEIKRESGTISNQAIVWRRWSDKNHLYSDCSVLLPAKHDKKSKKYRVTLMVTANTQERRKTLEDHLKTLQLIFPASTSTKEKPNKAIGDA